MATKAQSVTLVPFVDKPKRSHNSVQNICIAPDGTYLISAAKSYDLFVWDPQVGTKVRRLGGYEEGHSTFIPCCVLSRDARFVYGCSDLGHVTKWDVHTGEEVQTIHVHVAEEDWRKTPACLESQVAITEDENSAFSVSTVDNQIKVLDLIEGKQVATLRRHTGGVHSLFAISNSILLSAAFPENSAKIWDIKTGEIIEQLDGHKDGITKLIVSQDRAIAVSVSRDSSAIVWDLKKRKSRHILQKHKGSCGNVTITHDKKRIITSSEDGVLSVWDVNQGSMQAKLAGHKRICPSLAVSPTDDLLLSGDFEGCLKLWSLSTFECLQTIPNRSPNLPKPPIGACAFSPDGSIAVAGDDRGRVFFFRIVREN